MIGGRFGFSILVGDWNMNGKNDFPKKTWECHHPKIHEFVSEG
jgi:hypothetical protein